MRNDKEEDDDDDNNNTNNMMQEMVAIQTKLTGVFNSSVLVLP